MPNFSDYNEVQKLLKDAQNVEEDLRELAKEAHLFTSKPDGQWEPEIWTAFNGKPRYTFDQTTPIIDQISGQIDDADFNIGVVPVSGDASKDMAQVREGMIRSIENVSEADMTYNTAGRNIVIAGIDHWLVRTKFVDDMSFDQDIVIEPIHNSIERVWLDPSSQRRDRADARYGFLLSSVSKETYSEIYPDRSPISVDNDRNFSAYFRVADNVVVGNFFFAKDTKVKIVKTNFGRVFEREEVESVLDELLGQGERVVDEREVDKTTFFMRKFDGNGWLEEEKETVFSSIPLVPCYANFSVIEDKTVYHGIVQKLMDPQRVMNYSMSREIEEGALAPRAKFWMTKAQVKGHADTLATMNTNMDPIQLYNHDPDVPGAPNQSGGAQINPGLRVVSDAMQNMMTSTSGMFAASMGDNPNAQSGVAINQLQRKGNNVTSKYFKAMEVSICRTYDLIEKAIPRVYDTQRQIRILESDGTFGQTLINNEVLDTQTGQMVTLNDLSIGRYAVTCTAGQSFDSRQQETVSTIVELASIDPSIAEIGSDVLLQNVTSPGVEKIAERKRQQLLQAGVIPESQLDEEERAAMEAARNAPQQPGAAMVLAQAELQKAEADAAKVQLDAQKAQQDVALRAEQLRLDGIDQQLKIREQNIKLEERRQELGLKVNEQFFNQTQGAVKLDDDLITSEVDRLNTQANTLKTLKDAQGIDAIVSPSGVAAYSDQTEIVRDSQSDLT